MTQLSLLALSAILVALAVFVWRTRPDRSINRWFSVLTVFGASWVVGVAALQTGQNLHFWARFTFASASMIPATFLAFTRSYPTVSRWPSSSLVSTILAVGVFFSVLSLATPFMVYDTVMTAEGLIRKTGPLYPIFAIYFLITWLLALILFVFKWRDSRGIARAQLQYLGIALVLSGAGAITTNLLLPFATGRSTHSWIGPYFNLLFVVIVGHAIIRHRLMDLRLIVHRGLAYSLVVSVMSALAIFTRRTVLPIGLSENVSIPADLVAVGLVVILLLSGPVQRLIKQAIDPYLYRGRIDYGAALPNIAHRLTHLMQPTQLCAAIRKILTDAVVPEQFSMVVHSPDDAKAEPLWLDQPAVVELISAPGPVARLLQTQLSPSVLLVNPVGETAEHQEAHEALRQGGVELVVMLGRRGQKLGTVFLGPRRSGDAYFAPDLAFIESLADVASIALENALLYRQRIQILEYSDRLLESLDSAVVAVDAVGRIASYNPAAKNLLGLADSARGAALDALPSEIAWALALALCGAWTPREVEANVSHSSRSSIPVILSTAVLRDENKRISGALVVVTDLSTIKALEHNQRRIEHLALMARFYAGIAHEIRSPLASISNFVAMLQDRFDDPEYRDTVVRLLPMEVGRIVRLADRLRLMAPSEGGRLSIISLPPLLSDIVAIHTPAAAESSVRIILRCPESLPAIHGDRGQLVQLCVNLLNNAVEATPNGGDVVIEANAHANRSGAVTVAVRVIDSGVGIDPSARPKIFEPFFTTKPSGTGLGLSICKEIADFHHATLRLISRPGDSGTIAQVEFPAVSVNGHAADAEPAPTVQQQSQPSSRPPAQPAGF